MPRALALLAALCAAALCATARASLCDLQYCQCPPDLHYLLTIVNCTVPHNQKIYINEGDVPEATSILEVSGAEGVWFGANSLSKLANLRLVKVFDTKLVDMRRSTAVDLAVVNLYLEVRRCDLLRVEEKTFTHLKGPLSVTIDECEVVSLEGKAFSWLLTMTISNVKQLQMSSGAFMLDPSAGNVANEGGTHGPKMTIVLKHLAVEEFKYKTFGSSAASITLDSVSVRVVRPDTFSATTYNLVKATNSTFDLIESEAFAQSTLIDHLRFYGCTIRQLAPRALVSPVSNLNISHTKIETVDTGAINITVAIVTLLANNFTTLYDKGFELNEWTKLQMEQNKFHDLGTMAIVTRPATSHELVFVGNEIFEAKERSLEFIGTSQASFENTIEYKNNYFGNPCQCEYSSWLLNILGTKSDELFLKESYCTVKEFFGKCFKLSELNMIVKSFVDEVCSPTSIHCDSFVSKNDGEVIPITNPRFPDQDKDNSLTARNKKVIGIMIVSVLGCIVLVLLISFIRWTRRRGHCLNIKNFLISTNASCASLCDRMCPCRNSSGMDNARSISQLSVHEYSERHRLNEPRGQDIVHETTHPVIYTQDVVPMDDKTTQTLPEELTKELLESLREKLEDPDNYAEAREMIEHLYEMIKVEESCNTNPSALAEENIYDLPFQNTVPRLGKNKKQMISIGTRTPSIDKLLPLSPYNRQITLAHEYFEPKDLTVHLYAEITNHGKERKNFDQEKDKKSFAMPDVVAEQAVPRGPYLRAVHDKMNSSNSSSPTFKNLNSFTGKPSSPAHMSTIKSNKSTSSNSSMINRPLPEKPIKFDPGEGSSPKYS